MSASELAMKWNPKNLEIKTRTVEKTLEPLVMQVTTLVSSKTSQKKKGKSKRAHVLVAAVERATENFVERGEIIAVENPEIKTEMLGAVEEVRTTGAAMSSSAREFASDPCSSVKRGNMVRASRNLLSAVTRLLILADMIDVHLLMKKLRRVEADLEFLKSVSSQAELLEGMDRFGRSAADLMSQAAKRQYELKDPGTEITVYIPSLNESLYSPERRPGRCPGRAEEAQHDAADRQQGLRQTPGTERRQGQQGLRAEAGVRGRHHHQ